jgi:hypothetical protein
MVVHHHDVTNARQELRKNIREGHGWGTYHNELGLFLPLLAWGLALVLTLTLLAVWPGPLTIALLIGILWLPALRRAARRAPHMPAGPLTIGLVASPAFDLVFLFNYVRGLARRTHHEKTKPPAKETEA